LVTAFWRLRKLTDEIKLRYVTSHDIPFLAQGGGHGFSDTLKEIQNAVMINMEKFDYAVVDSA
jgi:FAD/FMN-containing dehydrogenase